jgi:hypothetical protein
VLEYTTGERVETRGRNLQPMYEHIHWHQAFRITEMSGEQCSLAGRNDTVVYDLQVLREEKGKNR